MGYNCLTIEKDQLCSSPLLLEGTGLGETILPETSDSPVSIRIRRMATTCSSSQ